MSEQLIDLTDIDWTDDQVVTFGVLVGMQRWAEHLKPSGIHRLRLWLNHPDTVSQYAGSDLETMRQVVLAQIKKRK